MSERIVIATASLDEHSYGPVARFIQEKGHEPVVYLTDHVLDQTTSFVLKVSSDAEVTAEYGGINISPDQVGALWFRKLNSYHNANDDDLAKQMHIRAEIIAMHDSIWGLYPDYKWLNSPANIKLADRKFNQFIRAQHVGFSEVDSVVTNNWSDVSTGVLPNETSEAIVKTIKGVSSESGVAKAMYTHKIDRVTVADLEKIASPYPGIYQPFVGKKKEWRVTVVADKLFAASVITDEEAKVDWRQHQTTESVDFRVEDFPDDASEMCVDYLGEMGLKYGAFDFIQTYDDELVFLECNPNGQYAWLENILGLPISEAIADELIAVATK